MKTILTKTIIITIALVFSRADLLLGQGFVNLNFESAKFVVPDPLNPYEVSATNAIPGWIPYYAGNPVSLVLSNTVSLSGGWVSVFGTNNDVFVPQIQGNYYIWLAGANYTGNETPVGIGQTAQIPIKATSFTFWGYWAGTITFGNQVLSVFQTGSTANYNIYSVDVSSYSGQTGELLFTTLLAGGAVIDNIQFSTTAVPEPGSLALIALGGALFAIRRKISQS